MADRIFYAMYDDDDVLKDGAKKVVSKGIKVNEVFSPFPVHGIDPIIGVKQTRLGIMAFLYGLTGLLLATVGMRYFMVVDWPMNIGGKPNFSYLDNAGLVDEYRISQVGTYYYYFLNNICFLAGLSK